MPRLDPAGSRGREKLAEKVRVIGGLFERDATDRRFICIRIPRAMYLYIITFGTSGAVYISSGLFVWPEILRFGMAGCHGMMSW